VDAIDNVTAKCHLLAACRERGLPIVCSTGASGRWDPTTIAVADLSQTRVDPLAQSVRKILRKKYGFPSGEEWGIPAVFSTEPLQKPSLLAYDQGEDFRCVCPSDNQHHTCDDRNVVWGTAGFVTGAFGLTAASVVIRRIVSGE